MGLSDSVCLFVCVVSVTSVHTGRTLANIKNVKITFVDFNIYHRMMSLRNLYSVILT